MHTACSAYIRGCITATTRGDKRRLLADKGGRERLRPGHNTATFAIIPRPSTNPHCELMRRYAQRQCEYSQEKKKKNPQRLIRQRSGLQYRGQRGLRHPPRARTSAAAIQALLFIDEPLRFRQKRRWPLRPDHHHHHSLRSEYIKQSRQREFVAAIG